MESIRFSKTDTIILIRSLVVQQTKPYTLPELMRDFKTEVGYRMPTFGYRKALDFLRSIPEAVKVILENRNCFIKPAPGQEFSYIGAAIKNSGLLPDAKASMPSTSKNSGILPDAETNICSTSKQPQELQSQNLDELFNATMLNESIGKKDKKIKKTLGDDYLIAPCDRTEKKENMSGEDMAKRFDALYYKSLIASYRGDMEAIIDKCVTSIALRESDIPFINLTYYAEVGDDFEGCVTEVYNPQKFYIHFKRFRSDLTKLMSSMQYFYSEYKLKYTAKRYKFRAGQICAAFCTVTPDHGEWYRAKVLSYGNERTTIFLIDYGRTTEVKTSDLKFLDRIFGKLPVQGVLARLAKIKPRDGKFWSLDCRKYFYRLVFEEEVVVTVAEIDSEERSLIVALSCGDTGDFEVDSALIDKRFAVAAGRSAEEESLPSVIYESGGGKGMLEPEDIGRERKPRVQVVNLD